MTDGSGINRRRFMQGCLASAALSVAFPGLCLANANTDNRLIVVLLRGGMDGLSAVVPVGDSHYDMLRGNLAMERDNLLPLDRTFYLHPAMEPVYPMFRSGELAMVNAVAIPYRDRSHFDAQNVLELGSETPHALNSGWLNRVAAAIDEKNGRLGLAIGMTKPMLMQGPQPVGSWAPSAIPDAGDDFLSTVQKLYANDPALQQNLQEGMAFQEKVDAMFHEGKDRQMARVSRSRKGFPTLAETAGKLLSDPDGPRLASLEMGGWDTHVNQGLEQGQLANNLGIFAEGLVALKKNLGQNWQKTVVIAMTEFGRTARPNGTNGTDHGTAGVAFVAGGSIKGGRVITKWPGLRPQDLYQNRDLMPTLDIRGLLKSVLQDHYGLSYTTLTHNIFPGSNNVSDIHILR